LVISYQATIFTTVSHPPGWRYRAALMLPPPTSTISGSVASAVPRATRAGDVRALRRGKNAGARGAALSGAGPRIIAFAVHHGEPVARALTQAAQRIGLAGTTRVVSVSPRGAEVRQG